MKARVKITPPETESTMMSDESLITKYRPRSFDQVIGHNIEIRNFQAAARVSRVFLFSGPSGIGKTTLARLGAQHVGVNPAMVQEVNAADYNGVDEMRELVVPLEYVAMAPRAYIMDECHRITPQGWTVLNKPLEETPKGMHWFFCTTDISKVPDTILTRCAVFHLQSVSTNDLTDWLGAIVDEEGWQTVTPVIALCAQYALGSPRRALAFLEVCYHCDTRDQAAKAINVAVTDHNVEGLGYRLAQALVVTPERKTIQALLKKIREAGEYPESIRQVINSYFATVVENCKTDGEWRYAAKVLEAFADPVTDYPSLVLAVSRAAIGN
jgi:DNA polymerase III gamma/tau subunit